MYTFQIGCALVLILSFAFCPMFGQQSFEWRYGFQIPYLAKELSTAFSLFLILLKPL
jgi:hypothetical protein